MDTITTPGETFAAALRTAAAHAASEQQRINQENREASNKASTEAEMGEIVALLKGLGHDIGEPSGHSWRLCEGRAFLQVGNEDFEIGLKHRENSWDENNLTLVRQCGQLHCRHYVEAGFWDLATLHALLSKPVGMCRSCQPWTPTNTRTVEQQLCDLIREIARDEIEAAR